MDNYEKCSQLDEIPPMKINDKNQLIYFSVAPNIDTNLLQGLEIDLQSKELQLFECEDLTFGVQVHDDQILTSQLMCFVVQDEKLIKSTQFSKIVRIFEVTKIPSIKKKAIKKFKPVLDISYFIREPQKFWTISDLFIYKYQFLTYMKRKQQRDKSPVISINIMKENQNKTPQTYRASLNLTKVLESRKSNMNSLWDNTSQQETKLNQTIDSKLNKTIDSKLNKSIDTNLDLSCTNLNNKTKNHKSTDRPTSKFDNYFQRHSMTRGGNNTQRSARTQSMQITIDPDSPTKENDILCDKHINRNTQEPRKIKYVCCHQQCAMKLLCNECKIKTMSCNHDQVVKLEQFWEQPILIFLQDINENELLNGLILQQMQLYQKVKLQAENSKQQLHDYFERLLDSLKMRINAIEMNFTQKIDGCLEQIQNDVDTLVQTCLIYKDDFENRMQFNQDLGQCLTQFIQNSDNPKESILKGVQELQANLNRIPQLKEFVLKNKYEYFPDELQYDLLIQ